MSHILLQYCVLFCIKAGSSDLEGSNLKTTFWGRLRCVETCSLFYLIYSCSPYILILNSYHCKVSLMIFTSGHIDPEPSFSAFSFALTCVNYTTVLHLGPIKSTLTNNFSTTFLRFYFHFYSKKQFFNNDNVMTYFLFALGQRYI